MRVSCRMKPRTVVHGNSSIFLFLFGVVVLFIYMNRVQPYYYIDEVFHIPQALRYCAGNFTQWDPKITTLPGLYIVTALILSPLSLCNIQYLRCINLFGTCINLYLAYNVVKEICMTHRTQKWNDSLKLEVAYNITLLPPLFFWHFLYYTDVVSANTILLMLLLHLRKKYKLAAFAGCLAILVRQTNIIWLAFLTVERALDLLDCRVHKNLLAKHHNSATYVKLLWKPIMEEIRRGPTLFIQFVAKLCNDLLSYLTVCLMFLAFVIWNKGVVVGDRTAHIPTIHIPQLFYFSVFVFAFSWPYMVVHWRKYLSFVQGHWILGSCFFALLTIVVHFNTLVHPYVLADNRHYVFYFWNMFMGRYAVFKYLLIPLYSFTLYTMIYSISHLRFMTQINYMFMVSVVLVPQLLLEARYFIVPYIFYRLSIQKPKKWQVLAESFTILVANFLQFFLFAHKVFYWEDQPYPQRISW